MFKKIKESFSPYKWLFYMALVFIIVMAIELSKDESYHREEVAMKEEYRQGITECQQEMEKLHAECQQEIEKLHAECDQQITECQQEIEKLHLELYHHRHRFLTGEIWIENE